MSFGPFRGKMAGELVWEGREANGVASRIPSPLPSRPGTYLLLLALAAPRSLPIGALGAVALPPGLYAYAGSARGPGGIRARLGRHLAGSGRLRWHIDGLRQVARPVGALWGPPGREHAWVRRLLAHPWARVPVPRFGASDCPEGCPAHLIAFPPSLAPEALEDWLAAAEAVEGVWRDGSALR